MGRIGFAVDPWDLSDQGLNLTVEFFLWSASGEQTVRVPTVYNARHHLYGLVIIFTR